MEEPTAEAEKATIRYLLSWLRCGPLYCNRVGHQTAEDADFEGDSSSDAGCDVGDFHVHVAEPSSSLAGGHSSADKWECWLCGDGHKEAECPVFVLLFSGTSPAEKKKEAMRPLGVLGFNGVRIPKTRLQVKDVPADGNCLFHAIGREIATLCKGDAGLPPNPFDGQVWRELLMDYVQTSRDIISGTTVQDWVCLLCGVSSPAEYAAHMSHVRGRDTWGGFVEASLIASMWKSRAAEVKNRALSIVMLQQAGPDAHHTLSHSGSEEANSILVIASWTGLHWMRARVQPAIVAELRAWIARA